jgi:hypothetical protein
MPTKHHHKQPAHSEPIQSTVRTVGTSSLDAILKRLAPTALKNERPPANAFTAKMASKTWGVTPTRASKLLLQLSEANKVQCLGRYVQNGAGKSNTLWYIEVT